MHVFMYGINIFLLPGATKDQTLSSYKLQHITEKQDPLAFKILHFIRKAPIKFLNAQAHNLHSKVLCAGSTILIQNSLKPCHACFLNVLELG
jgi:hypothetical protein